MTKELMLHLISVVLRPTNVMVTLITLLVPYNAEAITNCITSQKSYVAPILIILT